MNITIKLSIIGKDIIMNYKYYLKLLQNTHFRYFLTIIIVMSITYKLCRMPGTFLLSIILVPLALLTFVFAIISLFRIKKCVYLILISISFLFIFSVDKIFIQ